MEALWQWRAEASQTLRSLQASKAKLVWRFSGEAQEFPRPESVAEERVRKVERSRGYALPEHRVRAIREAVLQGARLEFAGTVSVSHAPKRAVVEIETRAPVLGLEDYPDLWLPAKTLVEFGKDYCIDYSYCLGYQSFAIAHVYKTPAPAIVHPAPLEVGGLYPFGTVDFVLLSGTPIVSVYGSRPDDYVQESDTLVLRQPSDGVEFALVLAGERLAGLRWATERLHAAYTLEAFHTDLRQLPTQVGVAIEQAHRRIRAAFTLEQIADNAVAPSLPVGVSVNDFRLSPVNDARDCRRVGVCYEWRGRLPSAWQLRWLARWRGTISHPRSSCASCSGGSCTLM
jgi:hypothetical protein